MRTWIPYVYPPFCYIVWAWDWGTSASDLSFNKGPDTQEDMERPLYAHPDGEQFQQLPCAILSKQRRFHPLLPVDVLEHIESQLVVHFHLADCVVVYCYLEILY